MSIDNSISCVAALEENSKEIYLETTSVLLKLADNVLKEPSNPKFRSIRLSNPTVANKLLPSIGAMECLFLMGFQEGEDSLVLPSNFLLGNVKKVRDEIFLRRSKYVGNSSKSTAVTGPNVSVGTVREPVPSISRPTGSGATRRQLPASTTSGSTPVTSNSQGVVSFLKKIENNFQAVLQYEDKAIQAKAMELIPVSELEIAAMNNMRKLQLAIKQGETKESECDVQDLVLMELLKWFKTSFFKWVDTPECESCTGLTKLIGVSTDCRNPKDTHRVELYECTVCKWRTLFPRYNRVEKLLQTRRGRCGEWANCFTLLCRTLGWDARHVVDETDHVWTEVYSGAQGRWLHCDPCENACDTPLMYECGWGKKLSYVIAYSRDEIQDVTWRYSSNHAKILSRRKQCSEEALLASMTRLRRTRQSGVSSTRRAYLDRRLLTELVEFLVAKHPTGTDVGGRSSGSLAWRLARGETGPAESEPHTWTATDAEIALGKMQILYSTRNDKYLRPTDGNKSLDSFQNGAFEVKSILRKEEKDWKKVYLARTEGSAAATIKWKFAVGGDDLVVDRVRVVCQSQVYENGQVVWLLCNDDACIRVDPDKPVFDTDVMGGSTSLTLTAELSGGKGENAWQHTQLLRQDLGDCDSYPLDVTVTFRRK